jgi:hypothetical protein
LVAVTVIGGKGWALTGCSVICAMPLTELLTITRATRKNRLQDGLALQVMVVS